MRMYSVQYTLMYNVYVCILYTSAVYMVYEYVWCIHTVIHPPYYTPISTLHILIYRTLCPLYVPYIGVTIMALRKHPNETAENKRLLKELIEKWSRPIFNKSGIYVASVVYDILCN